MAGVYFEFSALAALIEHHIGIAKRYSLEKEDMFCVVSMRCADLLESSVKNAFQKILRESDAITNNGDYYFLVLTSTKSEGAKKLVENLFEYLGTEVEYEIFHYANNGISEEQNIDEFVRFIKNI